jgi:hypothetical protein
MEGVLRMLKLEEFGSYKVKTSAPFCSLSSLEENTSNHKQEVGIITLI